MQAAPRARGNNARPSLLGFEACFSPDLAELPGVGTGHGGDRGLGRAPGARLSGNGWRGAFDFARAGGLLAAGRLRAVGVWLSADQGAPLFDAEETQKKVFFSCPPVWFFQLRINLSA